MKLLVVFFSILSINSFAQFNYGAGANRTAMGQMGPGKAPDFRYVFDLRESEVELIGEVVLLVIPSGDLSSLSATVNNMKTKKDAVRGELIGFEASGTAISYIIKIKDGEEVVVVNYFGVNSASQLEKLRFVL